MPTGAPIESAALPGPNQNQFDALDRGEAARRARAVFEAHRKALVARRRHDLTLEKYLLHIDGEGDAQWADILHGQRVAIPRLLSPYRETENLLRPIVDNQVAYHTTMPFRFVAESKQDRESRDRAAVDAAFANYVATTGRWNTVFAQAMYMACAAGFCPVHVTWRDDLSYDAYEPLYATGVEKGMLPRRGRIDVWVGNPFDTSYNPGAKRDSIQVMRYGRVLPTRLVRQAFAYVPGIERLEGSRRLPSAAVFQRIARRWADMALNVHGDAALHGSSDTDEDLIALVCEEVLPGVDPDWPTGRLTIIAVQGTADSQARERGSGSVSPVLLWEGELPGGRRNAVEVYSHHRFDDVHGKPFVADLDDLQVGLNIMLSKRREYIEKAIEAPTIAYGQLREDAAEYNGFTVLEVDGPNAYVQQLQLSPAPVQLLDTAIAEKRQAMYTLGGYQAASRGESRAGDPYRKVIALAQQDDVIHGPTHLRFRESVCELMATAWCLMKAYGDVPWEIDLAGEDFAVVDDAWLSRDQLSEHCPTFRLVSGYGATPEVMGQQLLDLVTTRGADGRPLLTTDEFRKRYPDRTLYEQGDDPSAVQRRHARAVAGMIRKAAARYQERTGYRPQGMADPWLQQAGYQVFMEIEQMARRWQSDDAQAHIAELVQLVQDDTENPIARVAADFRLQTYYQWLAMQQQAAAAPVGAAGPAAGGGSAPGNPEDELNGGVEAQIARDRQAVMAQMQGARPA